MFEERKKKTLAFEIWDFLCEEYKKKYNSAIFPFINDRCCFIVVNIVFHAPWSITCLSHVLIFYIVYIWFHFCKKKKPKHFIVYILLFHHETNLYWGIEPLPTTYVCFFYHYLNYFLAWWGMTWWTIVSKTCRRVKYIVCEQFYLTSMTIILNWNLHSVEFNGLIALLFSVNGFFFTVNLLGMWAFLFNIIYIVYI